MNISLLKVCNYTICFSRVIDPANAGRSLVKYERLRAFFAWIGTR